MAITTHEVEKCICDLCKYEWFKRAYMPVQCPRCKSPEWNGPVKKGKKIKE